MKKIINKSIDLGQAIEAHNLRKLKIKSIKPHTNFAEEIYQAKSDKFLDTIFYTGVVILVLIAITYIIIK